MAYKIFLLLLLIGLSFSNILNQINQRKLEESNEFFGRRIDDNSNVKNKLMFVGFGNFSDGNLTNFEAYFINSTNCDNLNNFNITISFKSNKKAIPKEVHCSDFSVKQEVILIYKCNVDLENSASIENQNFDFMFYNSKNVKVNVDIDNSFFYKDSIDKQIELNNEIDFNIFYLENNVKNENKYSLKGDFLNKEKYEPNINLSLSGNIINCSIDENDINFDLNNKIVNDKLHGKILIDKDLKLIVIYAKDYAIDLIIYPKNQINNNLAQSYIELLNFGDYKKENEKNATVKVYLRGDNASLINLKRFIKFPINISYSDNYKYINATGQICNNYIEKGYIIYAINFPDTADKKNIKDITFDKIFFFSDDDNKYEEEIIKTNQNEYKILNAGEFDYKVVKPRNKNATYDTQNSFSLDFDFGELNDFYVENKSRVLLSFIPKDNDTIRDEVNCTFQNKTSTFTIFCQPKKDVYAYINTLIINLLNPKPLNSIISNTRLRFLQNENYRAFYSSSDAQGSIDYEYNPLRPPSKTSSSNRLSAGAIVAIVLSSVAAICAIIIAFYCLSRRPNPSSNKKPNEISFGNSTSAINN